MRVRAIICAALLLSLGAAAGAVERDGQKNCRFEYDVTLDMLFNNRENDSANHQYTNSGTLFGAVIAPEIGFSVRSRDLSDRGEEYTAHHKVMLGVNIVKDFGSTARIGEWFDGLTMYYELSKKISPKCSFGLDAGVFPRSRRYEENYSDLFFSDSLRFCDAMIEGMLFHFERPKCRFELGVDWIGMKEPQNRERFMLFSSGGGDPLDWLHLGYAAYMFHYASSGEVSGVVDNAIVNPFVEFRLGEFARMNSLDLRLGYIQAYQRDRLVQHDPMAPMGGEFVVKLQNWGVGLQNRFYFGYSMMPLYGGHDAGGYKYGPSLYYGEPYWMLRPGDEASMAAGGKATWGDRLDVYYQPRIARGLHLDIRLTGFFNGGFSGWNQTIGLTFNLCECLGK